MGKAKNLKNRVSSYFSKQITGEKTKLLVSKIHKIKIIKVNSEIESLLLEANLIKKYKPHYNIRLINNNAYQMIRITIHDEYPKVLISRQASDQKSLYFGPYPSGTSIKMVLKFVRKIFPFQSVYNHTKRICLFNHLGLCPCPPVFNSPEFKKIYKKNIQNLIKFLEGKKQQVIQNLEKERGALSKTEHFEEAKKVQRQIDAIAYITSPMHSAIEYEHNPNLSDDLRKKETTNLSIQLQKAGVAIGTIQRIECYDISNISGIHATGSMVVFINGEKNSALYRRFKIRQSTGPNDFAMIQEVLQRRIQHKEWNYPDLIIVDGGKGQVSSAYEVFKKNNITIPVIGLAKREEIIITSDFTEIKLPKNSEELLLIMRIRDEAHRFAITYHRKLRSKFALK